MTVEGKDFVSRTTAFTSTLILIVVTGLLLIPSPLPRDIGTGDFRPYWSSAYLLARGQDFSNPANLDRVERLLTGWEGPFTMYAWFAPIGNIILLPFTLLAFERAAYYWFLANVVFIFSSVVLIWRNAAAPPWIPLVAAFGFSMTLLSLITGQVNTLVFLGLALYLWLSRSPRSQFIGGASLVLTTIKAHLVIFTLPILLLEALWHKEWRILGGFTSAMTGSGAILFLFHPTWHLEFWKLVVLGMTYWRDTPTLAGLLVVTGGGLWAKWIWVVGLACAVAIWWVLREKVDRRTLADVSILGGMMLSPLDWSYDQIMLLFPLLRILEWVTDGSLARRQAVLTVVLLIIGDAITFYQRVTVDSEEGFFWVPIFSAALYAYAWRRRSDGISAQRIPSRIAVPNSQS